MSYLISKMYMRFSLYRLEFGVGGLNFNLPRTQHSYSIDSGKLGRCIARKLCNQRVIILMCSCTQWCNHWTHRHIRTHVHVRRAFIVLFTPQSAIVHSHSQSATKTRICEVCVPLCLRVSAYMSINCGDNSIFRCEYIECIWIRKLSLRIVTRLQRCYTLCAQTDLEQHTPQIPNVDCDKSLPSKENTKTDFPFLTVDGTDNTKYIERLGSGFNQGIYLWRWV